MTDVIIHDSRVTLVEADLVHFEQQLGFTLPSDYRAFLLRHNGGYPEPNYFPIANFPLDDYGILEWLLCLEEGYTLDIRRHLEVYRDRIPQGLLPIARDPGGNILCLSLNEHDKGTIFYWDHEGEVGEGAVPDLENVYFVAHSFDDLLSKLTIL